MKCSFCGFEKSNVIEGINNEHICIDCITSIKDEMCLDENVGEIKGICKPHEIKNHLDKYIIGQDKAKKIISVEIYNHLKRINSKKSLKLPKSNVLLIGPTGCGKTYMMETVSKYINLPIYIADASALTSSGYEGLSVDNILKGLIDKAKGDFTLAERGIIFIDEIDKIAKESNSGGKKDVKGDEVQKELLKVLEGTEYYISSKGRRIDTSNILFICSGAFDGIDKIIENKSKKVKNIGFKVTQEEEKTVENKSIEIEDLIKYGMNREFVGRLHTIAVLNKLTKEDLRNILIKPKNSIIRQYRKLLKVDGVILRFDEEVIEYIIEEAYKRGTGARSLNSIISERMNNIMYEIPLNNIKGEYLVKKDMFLSNNS